MDNAQSILQYILKQDRHFLKDDYIRVASTFEDFSKKTRMTKRDIHKFLLSKHIDIPRIIKMNKSSTKEISRIHINNIEDLIRVTIINLLQKNTILKPKLKEFAKQLDIESGVYRGGKYVELNKDMLVKSILKYIKDEDNLYSIINAIKHIDIGVSLQVKDIIKYNIPPVSVLNTGLCATISSIKKRHPKLMKMFSKKCELFIKNNRVVSNCKTNIIQGLYMLVIEHNSEEYIVKLGSFAETQGMSKRITSFGGGCYDTGSLTNQWFQKFISKALESQLRCRFYYYEHHTKPIYINNLLGDRNIKVVPYVIRPLEAELFEIYAKSNHNIVPIFGSNCTSKYIDDESSMCSI